VGERALSEAMKDKFGTVRGKRGMDVQHINNKRVRFATKVLPCKLVRKCCRDEVLATIISTREKCVE
jgi:hypothetical protein